MARITVEDCLENIDNIFEMVLVAAKRARRVAPHDRLEEVEDPAPVGEAQQLRHLARDQEHRHTLSDEALYERIAMTDIRRAADLLRPEYDQSLGRNGYVSLEVSPRLATNTIATAAAARRLWKEVDRPNLMIKVPATREGLVAIETLLAEAINVNVTLLFSVERYASVLETYQEALEERLSRGLPLGGVASVASFFLSRIDVKVDALLDGMVADDPQMKTARELRGCAAIASAALAYRQFQSVTQNQRWQALARAGAMVQRLLWASTGTKDPTGNRRWSA